MKLAIPRSTALKAADYLDRTAADLETCHWDPRAERVTPAQMRHEIERVRKWVAAIRRADDPFGVKP